MTSLPERRIVALMNKSEEILTTYAAVVRTRLRHHLRLLRAARAEYEADVRDWYENGDGRSPKWVDDFDDESGEVYRYNDGGRGYRYPYCEHGTSLWTDYDNICGGCEDGTPLREIALSRAQNDVLTFDERMKFVRSVPDGMPSGLRDQLVEWAVSPFTD